MPVLVQARTDDEIADVIEKVRSARDSEVGIVLPRGNRALQTPLNARLLSQFSRQQGRRTAIVSDEPRVQELARAHGFPVYASVPAFERGIELGAPNVQPPSTYRSAASAATATAVQEVPPAAPTAVTPPPYAAAPGRGGQPLGAPSEPPPSRWRERRKPLYFAGAAAAVIGLLLFLLLAPSAKVTITLAGTPISKNVVIQGSTDPNAARQGDHILTAVINSTASQSFQATPSGSSTLPPTPAHATLVFGWNGSGQPPGQPFTVHQGDVFQISDHSITFLATQDTHVCLVKDPSQAQSICGSTPPNNQVPVQDSTPEGKGNVPANSITYWPQDPCSSGNPFFCGGHDFTVTNPSPATGGADSKQVTVASAADLSSWNTQITQIENNLTNQINNDLQSKSGGKSFAVDPGGNGKSVTFDVTPKLPNAGDQFSPTSITINGTGTATVYDPTDVRNDVIADLNSQVTQGDELAPGKLNLQPCQVTQAGSDGTAILACSASDFAQPIINIAGLKSALAGKNPGDAQKIVQSRVDRVQSVSVSEFPFGLFYLPFFSSRIEIDENFIASSS